MSKKKIKLKLSGRLLKKKARRNSFGGKKQCRFCGGADKAAELDYKNANMLKGFLTERGKILPSRISGNCCKHQRIMTAAIKKSRSMALLPYCAHQF